MSLSVHSLPRVLDSRTLRYRDVLSVQTTKTISSDSVGWEKGDGTEHQYTLKDQILVSLTSFSDYCTVLQWTGIP